VVERRYQESVKKSGFGLIKADPSQEERAEEKHGIRGKPLNH